MSFYVTKTVLVGPKWFWSDQIDLDLPIMISSWPKWNCGNQNEFVMSNCDFLEFPKNISFPKNPDQHTPMLLGVWTKDKFFITHIFSHINHVSSKKFFPFYVRTWAVMTGMVVHHNNDGLKICQSLQIIFFSLSNSFMSCKTDSYGFGILSDIWF